MYFVLFFFFKQKTAYEMRISDWSSDVCSSDLTTRLSLKGHPMAFLRRAFAKEGVLSCIEAAAAKNGALVRTAGIVLIRQRPGKGNAIFITIEDEGGIVNILLWARHLDRKSTRLNSSH